MPTIEDLLEQGKKLPSAEAEKHFTETIEQAEKEGRKEFLAELYNRRGIARRMLGRFDDAFDDYKFALICTQTTDDHEQMAFAHTNMADIHRVGNKNFGLAHVALDDALAHTGFGSLMHAKAADQRGLIFRGEGQYANALACYNNAITICNTLPKKDEEIKNRLGQIYQHFGESAFDLYQENKNEALLDQAYGSQEEVIKIFTEIENHNMVANAHKMMGLIALEKGDTDTALEHQLEAYRMACDITKYPRSVGITALYVAEVHLTKNNEEEAVDYLVTFRDHILDGSIPKHDYKIIGKTYNNVMSIIESGPLEIEGLVELKERFQ